MFALGLKLVEPGDPSRSYLFEKINSSAPQQGDRMRPTDAMSLSDQAIIRDWIIQLATSYENYVWATLGSTPDSANTGFADDFDGDGIINGFEYSGLGIDSLAVSSNGQSFQGVLNFDANSKGLTFVIQASETLASDSWVTMASRLRDQSSWQVSPSFSVNETSAGTVHFNDSNFSISNKFYRAVVKEE